MSANFQRARDPDQKAQRRQDLLDAARRLIHADGLDEVGLSAIAREAGVVKSNVYRYFGSREEILLELLSEDAGAWLAELELATAPLDGSDDVAAVATAFAQTIAARPLTCQLISVVAGVLERNASREAAEAFKASMLALSIRVRNTLRAALPSLTHERAPEIVRYLHALVAGLWPMAHPPATLAAILARPDYQTMRCDFERDLRGALHAMLSGVGGAPARSQGARRRAM